VMDPESPTRCTRPLPITRFTRLPPEVGSHTRRWDISPAAARFGHRCSGFRNAANRDARHLGGRRSS
jgi:hypothetical protein